MVKWEKEDGCVYFFKHKGLEPVKIGYSTNNDPFKRFAQFQTYAPFGAEIVGFERSSMALTMEQNIHKKYKDRRLSGEWFLITDEEIKAEIEEIKRVENILFE